MELVEFGRQTIHQRFELEGNEPDPWDSAGINVHYRPKERHVGLKDESGRLVAAAGMVIAEVEVGGAGFPVVGIGGVIVRASDRGRGLGREIVEAAVERAKTLGPAFALLFCNEDRVGFYGKLGFAEVDGEVLVAQPQGPVRMPLRTMWLALRGDAAWPAGGLTVDGLPF